MGITAAPVTRALPLACLMLLLLRRAPGAGAQEGQGFQLQQPQDKVSVAAGQTLTLTCTTSGEGPAGPVRWLKGWGSGNKTVYDQKDPSSHKMRVAAESSTDFSIRIRDVGPEDSGTYYCVRFRKSLDGADEVFQRGKGTEVSVQAKPTPLVMSWSGRRVWPGQSLSVTCKTGGFFPKNITVKWLKDGAPITAQQPQITPWKTKSSFNMSSTVTVTLQEDDIRSRLVCEVQHPTLLVPVTRTYKLGKGLRVPPSVSVAPDAPSPVKLNKTVNFTCHVKGFYPGDVAVTWLENGMEMKVENIRRPEENHRGLFDLSSLVEVKATEEKNGSEFTCRVVHDGQDPVSKTAALWIAAPAREGGLGDLSQTGNGLNLSNTILWLGILLEKGLLGGLLIFLFKRRWPWDLCKGSMEELAQPRAPSFRFAGREPSTPLSRAEPSRAEPSRAEPSRAEPSQVEPSRAKLSQAEPNRAKPSRAIRERDMGITAAPVTRALPLACLMLLLLRRAPGAGAQEGQGFQLQQPQDKVSVAAGQTLTLTCTTSGEGPAGPVRWLKGWGSGNKTVYDQKDPSHKTRVAAESSTDFSIRIRDVGPEDSGTYYCVRFRKSLDGADEVFQRGKGTEVSVQAKPTPVVMSWSGRRVWPGQSLSVTCKTGGFFPKNITVKWLKDGAPITAQQPQITPWKTKSSFNMSSTVTVTLQEDDVRSRLVCEVQHPTLLVPVTRTYKLGKGLRVPPSVSVAPDAPSPVKLNKTVNFTCHVKGFYPGDVAVTWLENGMEMKVENIRRPEENHRGLFDLSSLVEVKATEEKNGSEFTCRVVHDGQDPVSKTAALWIAAPAREGGLGDLSQTGNGLNLSNTILWLGILLEKGLLGGLLIFLFKRRWP
ncbi:uncharacterized protein LJ206_016336 [Theristicus caerulescens]